MKIPVPVLLTGATGFVGGHLAETLGRQGVSTRLLVRSASRLPFTPGPRCEVVLGDVTDREAVRKAMKGVRTVLHLAGVLRGFSLADYERVNVQGTRLLAEAALEAPTVRRFVFVSSLSAAGPSPFGRGLIESDTPNPVSFYGSTKLAAEKEVARILRRRVSWVILRPGAVYGPREKDIFQYFQMANRGVAFLPGRGTQTVSYVHVDDLVDAILRAAASPRASGKTYFAASDDVDWARLIELIGQALGKRVLTLKIPLPLVKLVAVISEGVGRFRGKAAILNRDKVKEAAQPAWICDAGRLRRELAWKPRWDLAAGIRHAAESYKRAGWLV